MFFGKPFDAFDMEASLLGSSDVCSRCIFFLLSKEEINEASGHKVNCFFKSLFLDELQDLIYSVLFEVYLAQSVFTPIFDLARGKAIVAKGGKMAAITSYGSDQI